MAVVVSAPGPDDDRPPLFGGPDAGSGASRPAAGREAARRLELNTDNRTQDRVIFVPVQCQCRTCPTCGPRLGWHLRQNLLGKAEEFIAPALLTLTIDRDHFADPEGAHTFVSEQGRIRLLMRHLCLKRWVWVLEFQQQTGTGWPHWHILIDLGELPRRRVDLDKAWALWRDKWGIGGVDLQVRRKFPDPRHAINYITKYMMKQPHNGYPVWVLESSRKIRLLQASRAIGAVVRPAQAEERATPPESSAATDDKPRRIRTQRRLSDRMARCKQTSNALLERTAADGSITYAHLGPVDVRPDRLAMLSRMGATRAPLIVETVERDFDSNQVAEVRAYLPVDDKSEAIEAVDALRRELLSSGEALDTARVIAERKRQLVSGSKFAERGEEEGSGEDIPF